ncbi:hypothetical protein Pcinc_030070 [Petrolisthes cinctipes]|uniref:Uncharacterized protein n=1 Tax=Petrolisthes cinctipes TaxID=88211 RepID=A0AAE1EZL9_PETCI|nr:hypothetical protein Pcinc_030070 [Petrolisthes cinctipes]
MTTAGQPPETVQYPFLICQQPAVPWYPPTCVPLPSVPTEARGSPHSQKRITLATPRPRVVDTRVKKGQNVTSDYTCVVSPCVKLSLTIDQASLQDIFIVRIKWIINGWIELCKSVK